MRKLILTMLFFSLQAEAKLKHEAYKTVTVNHAHSALEYVDGGTIGTVFQIPLAGLDFKRPVTLEKITVFDEDANATSFKFYFFKDAVTELSGDGGTPAFSDLETHQSFVGFATIPIGNLFQLLESTFYSIGNLGLRLPLTKGSKHLYALAVVWEGALLMQDEQGLTFRFTFKQH